MRSQCPRRTAHAASVPRKLVPQAVRSAFAAEHTGPQSARSRRHCKQDVVNPFHSLHPLGSLLCSATGPPCWSLTCHKQATGHRVLGPRRAACRLGHAAVPRDTGEITGTCVCSSPPWDQRSGLLCGAAIPPEADSGRFLPTCVTESACPLLPKYSSSAQRRGHPELTVVHRSPYTSSGTRKRTHI